MNVLYERTPGTPLMPEQLQKLNALEGRHIDTSNIPELPPEAWKNAIRDSFYRSTKKAVSLRLDEDVIAWLKKNGDGYQTRANQMLRELMLAELN